VTLMADPGVKFVHIILDGVVDSRVNVFDKEVILDYGYYYSL